MAERGSGRGQSAEARRSLTTDDLKKYIADATGKLADKIRQDLTLALQESKSELQGVKQRLQGLEDRVSQLSDRLHQVVDAQAGNVTVVAGSAKQGTQETADGQAFMKCFEDRSSFFKKRLREKLRVFCLSRQGSLYFPGHIPKFVGKLLITLIPLYLKV